MDRIDFEAMAERVRNWGRWGHEDNRGTLNLIGPEALRRGAAAARRGKPFSLGLRFDRAGPQPAGNERINPQLFLHALDKAIRPDFPRVRYNDDTVVMALQCATQWDALSHVHYDGVLYNGCKACDTLTPQGVRRLGVEHLADPGITSRGVLIDVARHHGDAVLPSGHAITPDDLTAILERHQVTVEPGDILVVRTGAMRALAIDGDAATYRAVQPGLGPECAEWLFDRQIAAVCADNLAVEVLARDAAQEYALPLHALCLRDMGMPLGEMFQLEALAADCAADGCYEFLLCAPPLGFTGAVGSPVNPIALK